MSRSTSKSYRAAVSFIMLALLFVLFAYLTLTAGSVKLSWADLGGWALPYKNMASQIFWEIRVPHMAAAVFAGVSLAVSGLALQTLFRNPLAGPFVLGISSGASLGVALSLLAGLSFGHLGVLSSAAIGALAVTAIVMVVASRFRSATVLLIVGLLTGYFIDALVSLLIANSDAESLKVYVLWGMGSFGRLTFDAVGIFALATIIGLTLVLCSMRYLNASCMGDSFARGLGVNVRLFRILVLLGTSILAASATAFCGPVAFVGIAVPHLTFMLFRTTNHRVLIPGAAVCGAILCMAASLFQTVPVNAVLSLVGVPVVLGVVIRGWKVR